MPYPLPPQHPVLSTTSVVTVVPCAVWNVPRSLGTSSSLWVGGPLHYGKREPRWEGVEGGGSGWGGESVCDLCTVKEGTRECWGDIQVRGTDVWPLYRGGWDTTVSAWGECFKISSDSVEVFFQFKFISAPIHLSSLSRVMLCWSPVAQPFPSQEGHGLQPDQVRGVWLGCIGTEWNG